MSQMTDTCKNTDNILPNIQGWIQDMWRPPAMEVGILKIKKTTIHIYNYPVKYILHEKSIPVNIP